MVSISVGGADFVDNNRGGFGEDVGVSYAFADSGMDGITSCPEPDVLVAEGAHDAPFVRALLLIASGCCAYAAGRPRCYQDDCVS